MKIKDKLVILTLLILIISFFIFLIVSSKNRENDLKEYYEKSINGKVIGLSQTRSRELIIRLKNNDKPILSGISFVNEKYFEIGDSISKPPYSENLYLFKKDKSKQIENYFYIDDFDKYDWKK